MKRLLKDRRGMTLMEIVVALALLLLVIVGTTPVMLSAFDGVYKAGEKTQEVYDAKTEIEQKLASRNSAINYKGFIVNFNGLGQSIKVNGNRAVSSLYNSLETLFTGAKARVYIASGSVVNDDTPSHTIVLQTSNIDFKDIEEIGTNGTETLSPRDDETQAIETLVDVTAYIPQKELTSTLAADIYKNQKANVTLHNASTNVETGRIGITISGTAENPIDFTTSPIKIVLKYLDENDKEQKVHTYLTIKTPTIMFAGETSSTITYYTSAGVKKEINKDGSYTVSFNNEPRKMNIGKFNDSAEHITGAQSTQAVPTGTVFKSINWITEYARTTGGISNEDIEFAETDYDPQYYVLTGTNGVIYRTYSFDVSPNVKGRVNVNIPGNNESVFGVDGKLLNTVTKQNQLKNDGTGKDVMDVQDTYIVLDDRANTIVYPAVWGGDFSHIFAYSTYGEQSGYTWRTNPSESSGAWQTELKDESISDKTSEDYRQSGEGVGQPGFYSNFASFGYYYNGWGLNTPYYSMNSRKISYVLTEVPYSMRVGGYMGDVGSVTNYGYDGTTFDRIWEQYQFINDEGNPENYQLGEKQTIKKTGFKETNAWYYNAPVASSMARSAIIRANKGGKSGLINYIDGDITKNLLHTLPVYLVAKEPGEEPGRRPDNGFAQLRIKALTTLSPEFLVNRLDLVDKTDDDGAYTNVRFAYSKNTNKSKITVTDAVYVPSTTGGAGEVIYVGTVAAYGWINQVDNVGHSDGDDADVKNMQNSSSANTGRLSSYWVMSNDDGTETAVYKHSTTADSISSHGTIRTRLMQNPTWPTTKLTANDDDGNSAEFFISLPLETVSSRLFTDVSFTLGYTSNREMFYTNIVYGKDSTGLIQSLKFCEPYYFQSHYGDTLVSSTDDHYANLYMNSSTPNYGQVSTIIGRGGVATQESSFNSKNNDYYNVWFPGEMYNMTKVATKDNVTVAVGYAVAGSAYTYLNSADNGSTALGGIFNDGVMAGMVLGQDNAFKSLLYFKDNESFDSNSLSKTGFSYTSYDKSGTAVAGRNYSTTKGWTYGTHARDSVQFTCVDISIVQIEPFYVYYAYYADNKGRVFRSLVAYKGTGGGDPALMSYVSDEIIEPCPLSSAGDYEDTDTPIGYLYNGGVGRMEEIKVNGTESFTTYFSKITSIVCVDKYIIVAGKSADQNFNIVVGTITATAWDEPDGENPNQTACDITWKTVKITGDDEYTVNDMTVVGDYLYVVGNIEGGTTNKGFFRAISLPKVDTLDHGGTIPEATTSNGDGYYSSDVALAMYAIAGKTT